MGRRRIRTLHGSATGPKEPGRGGRSVSALPLYIQIADALKERIFWGQIRPGESIGTQDQLMREFGVSMVTTRRALDLLREENLVVSWQGKGVFVRERDPVSVELSELANLSALAVAQGRKVGVQVRLFTMGRPPNEVARHLDIDPRADALHVQRLHMVNDRPAALGDVWCPGRFAVALEPSDFAEIEAYGGIEQKLGVKIGDAEQVIRVIHAPRPVYRALQLQVGAPVLFARKVVNAVSGSPLFHIAIYYCSDQVEFRVRLRRARVDETWSLPAEFRA